MSAEKNFTGKPTMRSTTRVVAVPVTLLPFGGIIILVGISLTILNLFTR